MLLKTNINVCSDGKKEAGHGTQLILCLRKGGGGKQMRDKVVVQNQACIWEKAVSTEYLRQWQ